MALDQDITGTATIRRAENLLMAEMDEEVILLSVAAGYYYSLADVGSEIWRRLETSVHVTDLVRSLHETFEAPCEVIERDLLVLLERLRDEGLITVVS